MLYNDTRHISPPAILHRKDVSDALLHESYIRLSIVQEISGKFGVIGALSFGPSFCLFPSPFISLFSLFLQFIIPSGVHFFPSKFVRQYTHGPDVGSTYKDLPLSGTFHSTLKSPFIFLSQGPSKENYRVLVSE